MFVIAEPGLFGGPFHYYWKDVNKHAQRDRPGGKRVLGEAEFAMVDFVHAARIFYNA